MDNCKITRAEFLKRSLLGVLAVSVMSKITMPSVEAASVSDNLGGGGAGTHIGSDAPVNKKQTWIDTGNRNVHKFWSEEKRAWVNIRATWDE